MRLRLNAIIAAAMLAGITPAAHAETLYVIEQLYVTVNTAPDGTGERVGQIKSGDKVELIERQGDQAHVRLASGSEGWVKSSYLSSDPPLREQVTARTAELEQVRKEKAQLEAELTKARAALTAASSGAKAAVRDTQASSAPSNASPAGAKRAPSTSGRAETLPNAEATASAEAAPNVSAEPSSQAPPPLFQDEPMVPSRPSWLVASAVALLALGVGFALGWRTLDKRIRAKYGGLRIY
jgi:SH3 domain protein